jgi:hypothetical protein
MENQRGTLRRKVFVEPIREWSFFKGDRVRETYLFRQSFNCSVLHNLSVHIFCKYGLWKIVS